MKTDRMKGYLKSATTDDWYSPYVGKFLWVSRKSFNEEKGEYTLKFGPTHLTVKKTDLIIIPRFVRKLFHAINHELPTAFSNVNEEDNS